MNRVLQLQTTGAANGAAPDQNWSTISLGDCPSREMSLVSVRCRPIDYFY